MTNLSVEQATLEEAVRLYGLRNWIEQSYTQSKDELGWADFMVRSDRAIRRHGIPVYCAFSFCWWHETNRVRVIDRSQQPALPPVPSTGRKKISREIRYPCWTETLRSVRAWLIPVHWLTRWWRAFGNQPLLCEFDSLLQVLLKGNGISLYLWVQQISARKLWGFCWQRSSKSEFENAVISSTVRHNWSRTDER